MWLLFYIYKSRLAYVVHLLILGLYQDSRKNVPFPLQMGQKWVITWFDVPMLEEQYVKITQGEYVELLLSTCSPCTWSTHNLLRTKALALSKYNFNFNYQVSTIKNHEAHSCQNNNNINKTMLCLPMRMKRIIIVLSPWVRQQ